MSSAEKTKVRSEAPIAALVFGVIAVVAAVLSPAPGFTLIAAAVAAITGAVAITKRTGQAWMPVTGIALAAVGVLLAVVKLYA